MLDSRKDFPARFWPPGISFPSENFAGIPARFPPGRKIAGGPKSRRDPDGIPAKIAAGSRQDPGSYFTREYGYRIAIIL